MIAVAVDAAAAVVVEEEYIDHSSSPLHPSLPPGLARGPPDIPYVPQALPDEEEEGGGNRAIIIACSISS